MKPEGLVRVFINTAWTVKHLFKWLLLSKEEGEVEETENHEEEKKEVENKEKIHHERTNTEIILILMTITVANLLFIALGGFLFKSTEGEYQETTRKHADDFRKQHCKRLEALYQFDGPEAQSIIREGVKNYTTGLYDYLSEQKWDGGKPDESVREWSFTASVLYSLVVVTCIGYGDTTPISMNGRLLTIIYALIGIPLLLLLIAVMGDKMGLGFKYLYWYITCRSKKIQAQLDKAKQKELEEQRALEDQDETVPKTPPDEKVDDSLINLEEDGDDQENAKEAAVAAVVEDKRQARREERRLKRKMIKEMLIPLHISVLVFALYNLVGAALFAFYEDNWNFFESFYFSVITLSTVGFGDYVFGKSCDGKVCTNSEMKLIFASFYILVGLSLVSMCFSHMAQTFKNNFYDFGVMFGVLKKKKEVLV